MFDLRKVFSSQVRKTIMYSLSFLPDSVYLKIFYFATTGKKLNLKKPSGYNEKLQWLKINERKDPNGVLIKLFALPFFVSRKV